MKTLRYPHFICNSTYTSSKNSQRRGKLRLSNIRFTLRKGHCPAVNINQTITPQTEAVKYRRATLQLKVKLERTDRQEKITNRLKNRRDQLFYRKNIPSIYSNCRSQWPRRLRRRSTAARLLRSWVRIPPGAWMSLCCDCCVLSRRGLCDELITRPEKSNRRWCVIVCDLETTKILVKEEQAKANLGAIAP